MPREPVGAGDGVVGAEACLLREVTHQVDGTPVATESADHYVPRARHGPFLALLALGEVGVPACEGAFLALGEVVRCGHQRSAVRREPQQPAPGGHQLILSSLLALTGGCDVPHHDERLAAAGEQGAVGAEGEALNELRMFLQGWQGLTAGPFPDFHEAIAPRGGQERARGVEGQKVGATLVHAQRYPVLVACRVPHLHGPLFAHGHELLAVGTEERPPDGVIRVVLEAPFLLRGGCCPYLNFAFYLTSR